MATLHDTLQRVGLRMTVNRALDWSARGLVAGGLLSLLLLLVDRGVEAIELTPVMYAAIGTAGALAGIVAGALSRPPAHEVASALDAKLALKDRLATAAAIEARTIPPSDFAPFVQADAQRIAARLRPRSVAPLSFSHTWAAAAVSVAALSAAVLYLPEYARAGAPDGARSSEEALVLEQTQADAATALAESIEALRDAPAAVAREDDLARLDELAAQLRRDNLSPREFASARDAAAEELDELAERMQSQAARDERVLEELHRRFEGMGERDQTSEATAATAPAEELADALSRGEYERAAQAVEDLAQRLDDLPPDERARLAEQLRQLGREMKESEPATEADRAAAESLRDTLREQGLSEEEINEVIPPVEEQAPQAEEESDPESGESERPPQDAAPETESSQPPPPPNREEIAERLQDQGVEREQAERLAEHIEEERERQEAREEADRAAEDVSRSLEDLADEVEEQPAGQEPPPAQENQQQEQRDEGQEEQQEAREQEGEQGEAREQQETQGREEGRERADEGTEEQQQDQSREQQEREDSRAEGDDERETARDQAAREQQEREGEAGDEEREQQSENAESEEPCPDCTSDQPCPKHAGAEQEPGGRGAESGERVEPGDQPEDSEPGNGERPQSATERMKEALRELEERRESANESRRQGDQARERAREIAEKLTPEERERMEQWSREFERQDRPSTAQQQPEGEGVARDLAPGRGQGDAGELDPIEDEFFTEAENVDLRDEEREERTIAEWLADDRPDGEPGRTGETSGAGFVGEAERAAERAVNDGAVPRRYHEFIQRYFGRLRLTIDKAAEKDDQTP